MKNIAIAGFDREGSATYRYLTEVKGVSPAQITILDVNEATELPDGIGGAHLGEDYLDSVSDFDTVYRTPGLPIHLLSKAKKIGSLTNLFFEAIEGREITTIGVTGTKGKGTTATLIHKMLEADGKRSHLVGNIGVPALEALHDIEDGDYVVIELSSFQLWDISYSPDVAVVLSVGSDHLDKHLGQQDYEDAKSHIVTHQQKGDNVVYAGFNTAASRIASMSQAETKLSYHTGDSTGVYLEDQQIMYRDAVLLSADEVGLPASFNLENICAAMTAALSVGVDQQKAIQVAKSFKGLPLHIEDIAEVSGVRFVNDSFSSAYAATLGSLGAFSEERVIVLVGGYDKGSDPDKFIEDLSKMNDVQPLVFGAVGLRLSKQLMALGKKHFHYKGDSLDELVSLSVELLDGNQGVVLFSPGHASFDMFHNFVERGELFTDAVERYRNEHA